MIINSITPYKQSSISTANVVPQVSQNHHSSVSFTGAKQVGALGTLAMVFGLVGCPSSNAPNTASTTGTTASTATATVTATSTATSTATTPDTAVTRLNAAWENAGISIPDPDQPPKSISYVDDFSGDTTTMTLDPTKTTDNTIVYKSVTNVTDTGVITYSYDPTTNSLTKTTVGDITGTKTIATITMDPDGYTVFTNAKNGNFAEKWRKINTGKVGIYDQTGNLLRTYDNFTVDGYLAKLQKETKAPIVRFAGQAKEMLEAGKKNLAAKFEMPKPTKLAKVILA